MKSISTEMYENKPVPMQVEDGYMHATAMCKASGRRISTYLRNAQTKAFLTALSTDMQCCTSALVVIKKGGNTKSEQGTWVHPLVAVNLAQWASPEFAVFVSKLVFEWHNKQHGIPKIEAQPELTVRRALTFLRDNQAEGYPRPKRLTPDHQAVIMFNVKLSIENSWPRSRSPMRTLDYFAKIEREFSVRAWSDILDEDFQAVLDFIVTILPPKEKNQIILREHEDKNFPNDLELMERGLYNIAKGQLNMIRERPLLEPAKNVLRFERR